MSETTDTPATETPDTDTTDTAASTEEDDTAAPESSDADEPPGGEVAEASDSTDATGPDSRLLEELDEHIRNARAAAEEALGDAEHTFVESGDRRSETEDDQTIAPPG